MPVGLEGKHAGANAIYYAVVTEADRQIGRLLRRLDELGLAENTIVLFSADNGPEDIAIRNASHSGVGSPGPFRGRKRSLYEGGIRVPFLLSWPEGNASRGTVDDDTPLCAVDLLPTFCALAGIDLPEGLQLDGEDMSGCLSRQAAPAHHAPDVGVALSRLRAHAQPQPDAGHPPGQVEAALEPRAGSRRAVRHPQRPDGAEQPGGPTPGPRRRDERAGPGLAGHPARQARSIPRRARTPIPGQVAQFPNFPIPNPQERNP